VSFCPFAPREVSVLAELTLRHLRYLLQMYCPSQTPSPDTVFRADRTRLPRIATVRRRFHTQKREPWGPDTASLNKYRNVVQDAVFNIVSLCSRYNKKSIWLECSLGGAIVMQCNNHCDHFYMQWLWNRQDDFCGYPPPPISLQSQNQLQSYRLESLRFWCRRRQ